MLIGMPLTSPVVGTEYELFLKGAAYGFNNTSFGIFENEYDAEGNRPVRPLPSLIITRSFMVLFDFKDEFQMNHPKISVISMITKMVTFSIHITPGGHRLAMLMYYREITL